MVGTYSSQEGHPDVTVIAHLLLNKSFWRKSIEVAQAKDTNSSHSEQLRSQNVLCLGQNYWYLGNDVEQPTPNPQKTRVWKRHCRSRRSRGNRCPEVTDFVKVEGTMKALATAGEGHFGLLHIHGKLSNHGEAWMSPPCQYFADPASMTSQEI